MSATRRPPAGANAGFSAAVHARPPARPPPSRLRRINTLEALTKTPDARPAQPHTQFLIPLRTAPFSSAPSGRQLRRARSVLLEGCACCACCAPGWFFWIFECTTCTTCTTFRADWSLESVGRTRAGGAYQRRVDRDRKSVV